MKWVLAFALVVTTFLAGCGEPKVVKYRSILSGLPGATGGLTDNAAKPAPIKGAVDLTGLPNGRLFADDPLDPSDASKRTMVARSAQHLMVHIYNAFDQQDVAFFTNQVLSEATRAEFMSRGESPRKAYEILAKRIPDIQALFSVMPAADQTPGVVVQTVGRNVTRVTVTGLAARDLRFIGFDMVSEKGNYKLGWFVTKP